MAKRTLNLRLQSSLMTPDQINDNARVPYQQTLSDKCFARDMDRKRTALRPDVKEYFIPGRS
ncbi:hypothetical protein [Carboxylicivirga sp. RSCT41]|uniref:hypothetical protein n=1 Tax=Carboxylicivirga agarovorans TaxID=3417570 RepID=UPI003D32A393